jgi:hypothetical protein
VVPIASLIAFTICSGAFAKYKGPARLPQPLAPMPAPDTLIEPPGEAHYVLTRPDGWPVYVNIDESVNFTDVLNRFYYNPRWRGEEWAPFPQYWIVERAVRMMPTWNEYDQQNVYHVGTRYSQFLEKYSGFGP